MIRIKDHNDKPFTLLKNEAYDNGYWAKKKSIQKALKYGTAFFLYFIDRVQNVRTTENSSIMIYPTKTKLQIELGCHVFSGRARRTLIKWLKETK